MNIIQTFWSGNLEKDPLYNSAGWLSPEYNWMSWALSSLTHYKFYKKIDLYTDKNGKNILVNIFKLPYNAKLTHNSLLNIPSKMWVLAKIYTYSIQKKPFLHVDGDIYIWKKYNRELEKAELIAQNLELNFGLYKQLLMVINEKFVGIPKEFEFQNISKIKSSNLGITGGQNFHFFKIYAELVFPFVMKNIKNIENEKNLFFSMVLNNLHFIN